MILTPEDIQQFKQIYFHKFGEELDDKEATEKANRVYDLHKTLFDYLSEESQKVVNQHESTSIHK